MKYQVFSILEPHHPRIIEAEQKHPLLLKLLQPLGVRFDHFIENILGVDLDHGDSVSHPQEDYAAISKSTPAFIVADGVTLEFSKDGTYPALSGASEISKITAETIRKELELHYSEITREKLKEVFRRGNEAARMYNESQGRKKSNSNFWDFDLFAATAAFAVIKQSILYWATICDSYVLLFDKTGKLKFQSPQCWDLRSKDLPPNWNHIPEDERKKIIRRVYRNKISLKGERAGYGVITGEPEAEVFLNTGSRGVDSGDILFLITDGFEEYMKLPEFISLFHSWSGLEARVREFTKKKAKEDGAKYAHERTLIAVLFQ